MKKKGVRSLGILLVVVAILALTTQSALACHIDGDINCDGAWGNGNTGGTKAQLIVDATASSSSTGNTVSMHCEKKVGPGDFSWSCNWDEKLPWATDWVFSGQASFSGSSGSDTVVLSGGPLECGEPPRLNISHVECFQACPPQIEVHFRLVHLPDNVLDYGAVTYSMTMPDNSVYNGTASFGGVTGDGAHYSEFINPISANGTYNVTSGSVTLTFSGGETITIDLANPGQFEVTSCDCPACSCDLLVLDKTSGEYPLTIGATINGTNAVEGQIDWGEGNGWEAAPGYAASHIYNNAGTFSVKAQVKGLDGKWHESEACTGEVKVEYPACSCDLLVLDKTSGEYPLTIGATINGTNAVEGQIDWGEGNGWEAAPGYAASHIYNNAGTFSVKAQVKGLDGNWHESEACTGEVKVEYPLPLCYQVTAEIDPETLLITGSGTGQGDEWRVVRIHDSHIMQSGSGSTANFAFTDEYEVNYRLQFRWDGGNWSSSGCLFSFSQALAATSSVDCDEETGESTLTVCIQNISEDRTYFATVKVGNLEVSDFIGPDEQLCVDKTKQGGTLKWQVLIGGKLFAGGQEELDSCTTFVPEPGTLLLLGSGLTGLAGYAKLRRRLRK